MIFIDYNNMKAVLAKVTHALWVDCPECGMAIGHACVSSEPGIFVHAERIRHAERTNEFRD